MTLYRFADLTLDTEARRLERSGAEVPVERLVFDVLVLLLRRAGTVVTKADLVDLIWQGRAISDDALTSAVSAARTAIGDRDRRLIRTRHRVGYVMEAEVSADAARPAGPGAGLPVRFLDFRGRSVAWTETGEGPALIVPAWWVGNVVEDLRHPSLAAFLAALGRGMRLIRYDRLGSGLSDRGEIARDVEDEAALIGAVADAAGAERHSIFAFSMAGPPSIVHAARHPARIERLCFAGTSHAGHMLAPAEVRSALVALVRSHWGLGSRTLADIFIPSGDPAEIAALLAANRAATDAATAAAILELAYGMDATDRAAEVSAPALVLHREDDRAVPAEAGRRLAALLADATFRTLPGNDHLPWLGGDGLPELANAFLRSG